MWPLVHEESDWVLVYRHFQDKIWRSPRLNARPEHTVVVRVDQRLVQVQHEDLLPHHAQPVSGDGGQCGDIILDSAMLLNLNTQNIKINKPRSGFWSYRPDLFFKQVTDEAPDFRE